MRKQCDVKRAIAVAMIFPFFMTACVNHLSEENDELANNGNIPLRFTADIGAIANARVQNNAFEEGDKVGVFGLVNSTTLKEERYIDNLCFTRSADGEFVPEKAVYYPDDGETLNLISYYPYQEKGIAIGESVMQVSVETDQSSAENYSQSDFLVATLENQKATSDLLSLSYEHKFFQLNVVIVPGEGENADDLCSANPELTVNGFYTDASYDFQEGAFNDYAMEKSITPAGTWKVEGGELVGKSAILIPQKVTTGYQYVTLKVGEKKYRCWLPDDLELQSGMKSKLEITFVSSEDTLLGNIIGEIEDWGGAGSVQVDPEVFRQYVNVATLDFEQSNVYKVVSEDGKQVAEICKEYLIAPEFSSQAIVAYPMKDGSTDLTKGVVVQLLEQEEKIHGGTVSWNIENHSLTYTPGTLNARKYVYVLADGGVALSVPAENEPLSVLPVADVFRDNRGGMIHNYPIVKIGTQYWMRDNLQVTLYSDGSAISQLEDIAEDATGYLLSDAGNYFYTFNVISANKLLPDSWKIPTWEDWNLLKTYIKEDASLLKSGIWKSSGDEGASKATNLTDFDAQPVGIWWVEGKFSDYEGKYLGYWTVDDEGKVAKEALMMSSKDNEIHQGKVDGTGWAHAVRALRK